MARLRKKGLSYEQIGSLFGVSRQYAHQLISGYGEVNNSLHKRNSINKAHSLALQRDNNTCQICQSQNRVIIHHIDGDDTNNNLENLLSVCRKCHQNIHIMGQTALIKKPKGTLTVAEAAEQLGTTTQMINYRIWHRKLNAIKQRGCFFIPDEEIKRLKEENNETSHHIKN